MASKGEKNRWTDSQKKREKLFTFIVRMGAAWRRAAERSRRKMSEEWEDKTISINFALNGSKNDVRWVRNGPISWASRRFSSHLIAISSLDIFCLFDIDTHTHMESWRERDLMAFGKFEGAGWENYFRELFRSHDHIRELNYCFYIGCGHCRRKVWERLKVFSIKNDQKPKILRLRLSEFNVYISKLLVLKSQKNLP